MSSPLHKFLFSPPPSPPLAVGASTDPNARFTPLRVQKVAADGQPDTFKLSVPHQSNRTRSAQSSSGNAMQVDVEAANAYDDNGKAGSPPVWSRLFSPRIRVLQARYVPRPLIRLGAFVLALFAAALLLTHVVLPVVFPLEEAGSAGLKAVAAPRVAVAAGAPVAHVAEAQAPPVVHRVPQVARE